MPKEWVLEIVELEWKYKPISGKLDYSKAKNKQE